LIDKTNDKYHIKTKTVLERTVFVFIARLLGCFFAFPWAMAMSSHLPSLMTFWAMPKTMFQKHYVKLARCNATFVNRGTI